MRTYLMLREKAAQFNADPQIQALLAEINPLDPVLEPFFGQYTPAKAQAIKAHSFDRQAIASRGLQYEKLDQLTVDLLLGYR